MDNSLELFSDIKLINFTKVDYRVSDILVNIYVCALCIFLNYSCFIFKEVEKLRQEKLEIDQQLKSLSGPQPGPYFPPPRERW